MATTLRDIAAALAKTQGGIVDQVTEGSPIINTANFMPSTHGLFHNFEEVKSVTGGSFVDIDGTLTVTDLDTDINKRDLSILGGAIKVGQDRAMVMGGRDAYFARKAPTIMRQTLANAEADLIYNVLIQKAVDAGNAINAGGSSNTNFSMLCVRWEDDNMTGVYDENMFDPETIFNMEMLYDGNLAEFTVDSNTYNGYGMQFKAYMAFLVANARNIGAIVNIDDSNIPTATEIDEMLVNARVGDAGTPYLYCHPTAQSRYLNKYKGDSLQVFNTDNGVDRLALAWNNVPVVTSYNFKKGTEANVTV